ncbi:MAG: hypothetical protein ACLUS5_19285 [Roseburia faecis]
MVVASLDCHGADYRLCIWLTHDLKVEKISKRQAVAEMLVEMANKFVVGNTGEKFRIA